MTAHAGHGRRDLAKELAEAEQQLREVRRREELAARIEEEEARGLQLRAERARRAAQEEAARQGERSTAGQDGTGADGEGRHGRQQPSMQAGIAHMPPGPMRSGGGATPASMSAGSEQMEGGSRSGQEESQGSPPETQSLTPTTRDQLDHGALGDYLRADLPIQRPIHTLRDYQMLPGWLQRQSPEECCPICQGTESGWEGPLWR